MRFQKRKINQCSRSARAKAKLKTALDSLRSAEIALTGPPHAVNAEEAARLAGRAERACRSIVAIYAEKPDGAE